jgi:hypothetical protein
MRHIALPASSRVKRGSGPVEHSMDLGDSSAVEITLGGMEWALGQRDRTPRESLT